MEINCYHGDQQIQLQTATAMNQYHREVKQKIPVTMDEEKQHDINQGERAGKDLKEVLADTCYQIKELLSTRLDDKSIMVMLQELQLIQRSSYYLEFQNDEFIPTDQQLTQNNPLWSLIDQRRLQRAVRKANTHIKLLLTCLEMIYQELVRGRRDLEAFLVKHEQGLVDNEMVASVLQKHQQIHQHINDFQTRLGRNLGSVDLQVQLIPDTVDFPVTHLNTLVTMKMPVLFNRSELSATSTTVNLSWTVVGLQSQEPHQQFEIHIKSLHPTVNEHGLCSKAICQSYNLQVNSLISNRYYHFSVKRVDTFNLVYGQYIDTIILKTV